MTEKVTTMVLKVDLECSRCYKKVKKVLCKFPQIQNQIYDKDAKTVTITVVCCSPEKIRDKLCYKGGGSIISIEIKTPPKPKPEEKSEKPQDKKKDEKKPEKDKDTEKKTEKDKVTEKKTEKPTKLEKESEKSTGSATRQAQPAAAAPQPSKANAVGFSCTECYHGHVGGPRYFGGPPPPSFPCHGRPVCGNWGSGGGYRYGCASRGDCLSQENPQACSFM